MPAKIIPIILKDIPDNIRKFMLLISHTEGTDKYPDPYRVLFGGKTFQDLTTHPNIKTPFDKTYSTAAGRYQMLYRTWKGLKLPDFSEASQDLGCIMLIKRRGAYDDLIKGDFQAAINKCNKEWASLPGSPYGQPTETMVKAINFINSLP